MSDQLTIPIAGVIPRRGGRGPDKLTAEDRDSLGVFYGEFLVSPVPAEASFNYCSHKCGYCFANLNVPARKTGLKGMMNLLAEHPVRETLIAYLLRERYPVCISNRVDPLAASNAPQSLPVMRILTQLGVPVQIQTKGGRQQDEDALLAILPPSVFYVSIAMLDDDLRRRIEPGAPSISARLQLIERLVRRGHHVVVGVNPLVPEWLPDPGELLAELAAKGVSGVWIERLHLNRGQVANMSEHEQQAIGGAVIRRAAQRKPASEEWQALSTAREEAGLLGLDVFSMGQPLPSNFFQPYRDLYPKTFPIMQDFINALYRGEYNQRLISFADFWAFFGPQLPAGEFALSHYIGTVAHSAVRAEADRLPTKMSYRDLLRRIWCDRRINQCPARLLCFAWAARWDGDGWVQYVDDEGLPYLVFSPSGFADFYTEL